MCLDDHNGIARDQWQIRQIANESGLEVDLHRFILFPFPPIPMWQFSFPFPFYNVVRFHFRQIPVLSHKYSRIS